MAKTRITRTPESAWRLRAELVSTRALLWVAGAGRNGEPNPEVHLYLYDRYWRLAEHHARIGHIQRAAALRRKAEFHHGQSGHDGPPFAAAMAMPLSRPAVFTRVVEPSEGTDDDVA